MNSLIVHPKTEAQEKTLIEFFKAFNVDFEVVPDNSVAEEPLKYQSGKNIGLVKSAVEDSASMDFIESSKKKAVEKILDGIDGSNDLADSQVLPPHVIEAVNRSEEQIKDGQFFTYDEVKRLLANR